MGMSRWSPIEWDAYASHIATKSHADIFRKHSLCKNLDPKSVTFRESRDSKLNPSSTPIIVAVDNTGSMGMLSETLIREGLGILIAEILERKPVPDPHVMFMAVGDAWCDLAPLQVTQFETDIRLADQLSDFFIEGGGGGNSYESYNLPWYFAATRTKCDAILKRNKKGYLFTVGDEPPPPVLEAKHVKRFLNGGLQRDMSTRDLFTMAAKTWEIFHIMIEEGNYYRAKPSETRHAWQKLLGQRAIPLSDHTRLAQLIVSTLEVVQGDDADRVAATWSGATALVMRKSLSDLTRLSAASGDGVAKL